ncbi:hypothetical protein ACXA45_03295 [Neomicrococcus lactis]
MTTFSSSATWGRMKNSYEHLKSLGWVDAEGRLYGLTYEEICERDPNELVFPPFVLSEEDLRKADEEIARQIAEGRLVNNEIVRGPDEE